LLLRAKFAGVQIDLHPLLEQACQGRTTLPELDLRELLPFEARRRIERLAPESYAVPSGRRVRLEYRDDGSVLASVKLQELFGLADSPRIGAAEAPLTFSLLAPNGRPVQTTRDLRSFWDRTYPEVRKQLRGRYPKHPWPEDPWSAEPTGRAKPRRR
jgi:ATP-dependent helicase HrpB